MPRYEIHMWREFTASKIDNTVACFNIDGLVVGWIARLKRALPCERGYSTSIQVSTSLCFVERING